MYLLVWILLFCNFLLGTCLIYPDLVRKFFEKNNLRYNVVLTCYTKRENVQLTRALSLEKNALMLVNNIESINILNITDFNVLRVGIVLDLSCNGAEEILLHCKNWDCFGTTKFWLIFYSSNNYSTLFTKVNLAINSEIKIAYPKYDDGSVMNSSDVYIIHDVYNQAQEKGGALKITTVGYYNELSGYVVDQLSNKYFTRRNLTGITLKGIIVLSEPFEGKVKDYLMTDKNIEIDTFNRFHSRLIHFCGGYYNIGIEISVSKSWGYAQPNGYVDGIVGGLYRREIDVGLSPIFVKTERLPMVSYGRKTWNLRAAFILRNPKSRKSYQIFLKPLSTDVWIGIIALCIASVMAQSFIYGSVKKLNFLEKDVDTTWSYIVLCTFGTFCQQGMVLSSRLLSGRIIIFFTLLLGSMVYQFYSASLVSFLLNVPTTLITNMQGILDQGFSVGCQDTLYDKLYLTQSTDNVTKEIYRRVLKKSGNKSGFLEAEEGMKLVKKGQYAFHVGLEKAYQITHLTFDEHTICELREVPMWGKRHVHTAYQKNSPFKDAMDVCLNRLSENGVLNREYIFWHPKKPPCSKSGSANTFNTGLEDFYPALAVLLIGILLSLQILIMEVIWYNNSYKLIKPYCD